MGIEEFIRGKISSIKDDKKKRSEDGEGEDRQDMTPEEAKAANASLVADAARAAQESLEKTMNEGKKPEEIKAEIDDILKGLK